MAMVSEKEIALWRNALSNRSPDQRTKLIRLYDAVQEWCSLLYGQIELVIAVV